jgi:hypothetical protein
LAPPIGRSAGTSGSPEVRPSHRDVIRVLTAAALGTAELQVLQRPIALAGVDEGLQVRGPW